MKTFGPKPWVLPQPVLVIGTYDKDGTPNAMNAAWGGQWDAAQIFISMGVHATTDNLERDDEFTVARKIDPSGTGFFLVGDILAVRVNEEYLSEDGLPDVGKMRLIVFDHVHHGYIQLGDKVGQAFSEFKKLG